MQLRVTRHTNRLDELVRSREHGVAITDHDGFRVVLVPERWESG